MGKSTFIAKILAASDAKREIRAAAAEWRWIGLLSKGGAICLCGRPLPGDACLIEHARTKARFRIGPCCAQEVLGWPAKNIFAGWRRVAADAGRPFNGDFVAFAHANGILTDWEASFYADTWRMRSLTEEQGRKRWQINRKALRVVDERMSAQERPHARQAAASPAYAA